MSQSNEVTGEELCVYGIKEFKLIETGVVFEGLIQKLLWEVFIPFPRSEGTWEPEPVERSDWRPRYEEDGGFWGAASVCEGSYTDEH